MRAARPATRSTHSLFELLAGPDDTAFAGLLLLRILNPADELVAGQGRYVEPGIEGDIAPGNVIYAKAGGIESAELARTFNCGVGMVAVVSPDKVDEATKLLTSHGETVMRIGIAVTRGSEPRVKMLNLDRWID